MPVHRYQKSHKPTCAKYQALARQKHSETTTSSEWVAKTAASITKFVYMDRDFCSLVKSHEKWDGGFTAHAKTTQFYYQYILSEFATIEKNYPGRSRHVRYEQVTDPSLTEAFVSAIIDFFGWDKSLCDMNVALSLLSSVHMSNRTSCSDTEIAIINGILANQTYFKDVIPPLIDNP
jgi:hypothetical protein